MDADGEHALDVGGAARSGDAGQVARPGRIHLREEGVQVGQQARGPEQGDVDLREHGGEPEAGIGRVLGDGARGRERPVELGDPDAALGGSLPGHVEGESGEAADERVTVEEGAQDGPLAPHGTLARRIPDALAAEHREDEVQCLGSGGNPVDLCTDRLRLRPEGLEHGALWIASGGSSTGRSCAGGRPARRPGRPARGCARRRSAGSRPPCRARRWPPRPRRWSGRRSSCP